MNILNTLLKITLQIRKVFIKKTAYNQSAQQLILRNIGESTRVTKK